MGDLSRKFLKAAASMTDEQLGAVVRACLEAPLTEGIPEARETWVSDAIEAIRVQGIPINPKSAEIRALLEGPGWWSFLPLTKTELSRALTIAINRAKGGTVGSPVALLCSILKRETAKGILDGTPAVVPGQVPRGASNTTTGEGRHSWEPDAAGKIKALLGHAGKCRERAAKQGCLPDLAQELLDEAARYEAEAARLGPEEEAGW